MSQGKVFLLPMILHEEGWEALPADTKKWIMQCDAFFVENEKTTRRFFKKVWKEMVIDDYIWRPIHKVEEAQIIEFKALLHQGKNSASYWSRWIHRFRTLSPDRLLQA